MGYTLKIDTLPFQAKDLAVGGCATIACWISLYPLYTLYGSQHFSPAEITERSITFPTLERNYPSTGLNLHQIKTYFNSLGLETEIITLKNVSIDNPALKDEFISTFIKVFIDYGLPVLAGLDLKKEGSENKWKHAVVISGYKHHNQKITGLFVHDDEIGPFSKVGFIDDNIKSWTNEWITDPDRNYQSIELSTLIVPIYEKMRLSYTKVFRTFASTRLKYFKKAKERDSGESLDHQLKLYNLNQYKEYLLKSNIKDKIKILSKHLPKYLWVHRIFINDIIHTDIVYDATGIFAKPIEFVTYSQPNLE